MDCNCLGCHFLHFFLREIARVYLLRSEQVYIAYRMQPHSATLRHGGVGRLAWTSAPRSAIPAECCSHGRQSAVPCSTQRPSRPPCSPLARPLRLARRAAPPRAEVSQTTAGTEAACRLSIQRCVPWGHRLVLVGSEERLGSWQPGAGLAMEWGESDVWTCELPGEAAGAEFKVRHAGRGHGSTRLGIRAYPRYPGISTLPFFFCFVMQIVQVDGSGSPVEWEPGSNRRVTSEELQALSLSLEWGRQGFVGNRAAPARGLEAASSASDGDGEAPPAHEPTDATRQWVGSFPSFMRSNEHSRERRGRWDSSSVQGAARFLVEQDAESPSWLHKLQTLKELLVDRPERARPELDAVAAAFVYAQVSVFCAGSRGCARRRHVACTAPARSFAHPPPLRPRSGSPRARCRAWRAGDTTGRATTRRCRGTSSSLWSGPWSRRWRASERGRPASPTTHPRRSRFLLASFRAACPPSRASLCSPRPSPASETLLTGRVGGGDTRHRFL